MNDGSSPEGFLPPEPQPDLDLRVLNSTARFIRRARQAVRDYPSLVKLLDEGRLSDVDMMEPVESIDTSTWRYTFIRMKPEFLDLQIERTPIYPLESKVIRETIHLAYVDNPSYTHAIEVAGKAHAVVTSSDDLKNLERTPKENEKLAAKARGNIGHFIQDMESQFLPTGRGVGR